MAGCRLHGALLSTARSTKRGTELEPRLGAGFTVILVRSPRNSLLSRSLSLSHCLSLSFSLSALLSSVYVEHADI